MRVTSSSTGGTYNGATGGFVGIAISTPTAKLHIDGGNATRVVSKYTNGTTSNTTANDGFDIGIDAASAGELRQHEAQPIVTYTSNVERMRVLANGQTTVNNASPAVADGFSVYGTGFPGAITSIGTTAIAGYSNNGTGIYGRVISAGGYGVHGESSSINAYGVYGTNYAPVAGGQSALGVFGACTGNMTGGVQIAVAGQIDATCAAGAATFGVKGTISTFANIAATAFAFAVAGEGTIANTSGVVGSGNATGLIRPTAQAGGSFHSDNIGLAGYATVAIGGIGSIANGNGITTSSIPLVGAGVVGTGTYYGVAGYAITTVNTNPLNNDGANGVNATSGGYFEVQNAGTPQTWSYVAVKDNGGVLRKIIGPGTVNTIVKDLNEKLVALSCPEAPENVFQDWGKGRLENGKTHVVIDPILSKNIVVNEKHDLRVFIQLEADCKGVFVTNKTQTGFDVVELDGGKSNALFSYMLTANRADEVLSDGSVSHYSAERFAPAPGPIKSKISETIQLK